MTRLRALRRGHHANASSRQLRSSGLSVGPGSLSSTSSSAGKHETRLVQAEAAAKRRLPSMSFTPTALRANQRLAEQHASAAAPLCPSAGATAF